MFFSSFWVYRGVNRDVLAGIGKWLCWVSVFFFIKGLGMVRG